VKILYHHRIRSKDGQYVHMEELTRALKDLGHEVILVGPSAVEKEKFGYDAGLVALLKRIMPHLAYECLEFGYSLWAYLRLCYAVVRYGPDCLYERYNLFLPAGVWLKRQFKLPMLLEVNAPILEERRKFSGISWVWLARWSEEYVWRGADVALPVTNVLADYVRRAGVPESRIQVIPNGVDLARFGDLQDREAAKRKLGLEGRLVLGFTGFMREWHGLERAIDLLAEDHQAAPLHLLLIGDGPARKSLEQRAKALGVEDRLIITGVIDRDQVAQYIRAFDVALQPAVVGYASPLKLMEYMALGCAIVAPDTPNIREILTHQHDALMFEPGNTGAFSEAIQKLCRDPELRRRISKNAVATIHEKGLTWENNAKLVVALFSRLGVKTPPQVTLGNEWDEQKIEDAQTLSGVAPNQRLSP
jgi:glycosyltransferase involved in cell wall biosynthesis